MSDDRAALPASWRRPRERPAAARVQLDGPPDTVLSSVHAFPDHHELGPAFDGLAHPGDEREPPVALSAAVGSRQQPGV
ncbi:MULTISPECIES: hypothetical protein [unclassified Streptomyces]|uniref:hypothetical protein n=1 Tax=unclassified Streptomyces TaxID=2593676 RepID=UPI0022B71AD7|nr:MULTISPECIES: hypothetical protein [unclassified Streptomyces]MCZ7414975.1 hypothetical protein [Streptomyces sp. WMMC897]MCZ7431918.1 hypothetical protein [Streptomyces sp. WMMC1477]